MVHRPRSDARATRATGATTAGIRFVVAALAVASAWGSRAAAQADNASQATQLAVELAERGGSEGVQQLCVLARREDPSVRIAALRGIKAVALRCADAADSVRAALVDSDADVREAGYEALTRVGDASDVPALLEGLDATDARTRGAVRAAMTALTGLTLPCDDASHWTDWWNGAGIVLPGRLDAAIRRLDRGSDAAGLREARRFLAQNTWFDVDKVAKAAKGWLYALDTRHRIEGYRVAATCRLGDLAEDVARAARDEVDPDVITVAACSANALGVAVDGFPQLSGAFELVALLDGNESAATDAAAISEEQARRVAQSRQQAADEQRNAAFQKPVLAATAGGSIGGGPVWLNLDQKRKLARQSSPVQDAIAAAGRALSHPSSGSWAWLGIPFLAGTVGLVQVRSARRRRKSTRDAWRYAGYARRLAGETDEYRLAADTALALELTSNGLHPEGLAAAGVRAREVVRVVASARGWLAENAARYGEVTQRCQIAMAKRDRLNRFVVGGIATEEERVQLPKRKRARPRATDCARPSSTPRRRRSRPNRGRRSCSSARTRPDANFRRTTSSSTGPTRSGPASATRCAANARRTSATRISTSTTTPTSRRSARTSRCGTRGST
jgi:hypothetical protein